MNIRSLSIFMLSFFVFPFALLAAPTPTGSIGGTLLDVSANTPMDNVTVFIFQGSNKTPLKVANTDEKGLFIFSEMLPGEYRVEVGFLGYLPFEEVVQVLANQKTSLGNIQMALDNKMLKMVQVSGLRSTMKLEVDKKIFTVDQTIAAAGANTSDILKNIPSVNVDAEGTISLRNSTNVVIWINGKPSGLTAENRSQVLEQMPAESIDRIEVISNPSAKFSAEGSAGIINIILKKDRKAGYYGSLRAGVSDPWGYNLGGNINYSNSKWDIYGNLGYRFNSQQGSGNTKRETYTTVNDLVQTQYMNSFSTRDGSNFGLFSRAGADYHINDKHTLGLSAFYMNGHRENNSAISSLYLDNSANLFKQQLRQSSSVGAHTNSEIALDYQWEIGTEHRLQSNVSFGIGRSPDESSFSQTSTDSFNNVTNALFQKEFGTGSENEVEFKLDYVRKISDKFKVEAGWRSTVSIRENDDKIYNLSSLSEALPALPFKANIFDYQEQQHAAYGTLTGSISTKLGYQFGLRAENSVIDFTSIDALTSLATTRTKNYVNLFPTIFLNYQITESSDAQLNYSRRINRPRGRALNPFVNISDSTNIWVGNPDLDPEYAHAFELNYLKTWDKHTLSAAFYHRMSDHVIQDIRYLSNGVMYQTPENVTNSTSSGMEFIAKDNLFNLLETTSTLNVYHQTMKGFTYLGKNYDPSKGLSWNFRLNGQLMLPKSYTVQLSGFYSAPRIVAQGEMKAAYSFDLGVRKSFFDRKIQVSLNGQNLLNSFKFENTTAGPGFKQESSNQFFSRSLRMNVTWNFGNLKPKNKQGDRENDSDQPASMDSEF